MFCFVLPVYVNADFNICGWKVTNNVSSVAVAEQMFTNIMKHVYLEYEFTCSLYGCKMWHWTQLLQLRDNMREYFLAFRRSDYQDVHTLTLRK
jgi:hypothetical protein